MNVHKTWPGIACLASLGLILACGGGGSSDPAPNPVQAPIITSFGATPSSINPGQSTVLAWVTVNATSLAIDNGVGDVTGKTTATVTPATTTAYKLTASNTAGSVSSTATVTVNQPVVNVSIAPTSWTMQTGESKQFTATVTGTSNTAVTWSTTSGNITQNGLYTAGTTPGSYTIKATSVADPSKSAQATVTVNAIPLPVISSFTANPATINLGQSSTLSWNTSGANSLVLDNGIGDVTNKPNQSVSPTTTTTYKLIASNAGGSVNATTTVAVNQPIVNVSIAPTSWTMQTGESKQFTATVTGSSNTAVTWTATSGSITQNGLYTAGNAPGSYTVKATSVADPTKSAQATVTVNPAPTPDFSLDITPPTSIQAGQTGQASVSATRTHGHNQTITLGLASNPQGITGTGSIPAGQSKLMAVSFTITVPSGLVAGSYALMLEGKDGTLTRTKAFNLVVTAAPVGDFTLSVNPNTVEIVAGQTGTVSVSAQRTNGHTGAITLDFLTTTAGITGSGTIAAGSNSGTFSIQTTSMTPAAGYGMKVRGSSGSLVKTVDLNVVVTGGPQPPVITSFTPTSGTVGTPVTLTGSSFNYVTGVDFNGTPTTYTKVSDTQITTTVPSGATTGRIGLSYQIGSTSGGTFSTSSFTVTAPQISVSLSPVSVTLSPGGTQKFTATVTGSSNTVVTWTATGGTIAQDGLYTAGQTSGSYNVRATSAADTSKYAEATVTISGGGPSKTYTWTLCPNESYLWAAFQDGGLDAPWQRITPSGRTYTFTVTHSSGKWGLVLVESDQDGNITTSITHGTTSEPQWIGGYATDCGDDPETTKTIRINGTVVGHNLGERATVTLSGSTTVEAGSTAYSFTNVAVPETYDLLASKATLTEIFPGYSVPGAPSRAALRRNLSFTETSPDPSTLASIDLMGSESFALSPQTLSVSGLAEGEMAFGVATFTTTHGATLNLAAAGLPMPGQSSWAFSGVPLAKQLTGELHTAMVVSMSGEEEGPSTSRMIARNFSAPANQSLTLPPSLGSASVSKAFAVPYVRLKADWPSGSTFPMFNLSFNQEGSKRNWGIYLSPGWYAAATKGTYTFPDFSTASGWLNDWSIQPAQSVDWSISGVQWLNYQDWHQADGSTMSMSGVSNKMTP